MKHLKKAYAILLATILAATPLVQPFTSVEAFNDVPQGSEYVESIETLTSLGLLKGYEDGTFKPQGTITRAEFATVIVRAKGLGDPSPVNTIFTDVPSTHWASGYIKFAADLEIVKGFGDGIFKPDAPVTYEQAVKMIVASLGYEPLSIHKGGYPTGYLAVANEKGITDKVSSGIGQPALRQIVAKLLYNSLEVPTYEPKSVGSTSYIENKDKTFLSYLSIVKVEGGQVDGNEHTKLNSAVTNLDPDEIEINGVKYKVGTTKVKDYFGQLVTYYYKKESGSTTPTLVMVALEKNRNEKLTIKADDIYEYSNNSVKYYENGETSKKESAIIKVGASFIYNGKYYDGTKKFIFPYASETATADDITIDSGELSLLDSDGDGSYDVIKINAYTTYIVGNTPNTFDYNIIDKYFGDRLVLDPNDRNIQISVFDKAGVAKTYADIRPSNVLSVAKSENQNGKKYIKVVISPGTVSGAVTETGGDDEVYIAGKKYEVSSYYQRVITEKDKPKINLGDSGTFYLDAEGKIANIALAAARGTNYGYIISAEKSGSSLSGQSLELRLYLPPATGTVGTFTTKKVDDKVKVDGSTIEEVDDVLARLAQSATLTNKDNETWNVSESGKGYAQLIKFATNSSGAIDIIDTLVKGGSESTDTLSNGFTGLNKSVTPYAKKIKLKYDSSNSKFVDGTSSQAETIISDSTKVIFVPANRTDEDNYSIKTRSYFRDDAYYYIESFDYTSTSSKTVKVAIVYGIDYKVTDSLETLGIDSDGAIDQYKPIVIVDSKTKVSSSITGDNVTKLSYYLDGAIKTIEVPDDNSVTDTTVEALKQGDVIRFSTKGNSQMNLVQKVFTVDTQILDEENAKKDGYYEAVYGSVYSVDENNTNISIYQGEVTANTVFDDSKMRSYSLSSSAKYYAIDTIKSADRIVNVANSKLLSIVDYEIAKERATRMFLYVYDNRVKAAVVIMK